MVQAKERCVTEHSEQQRRNDQFSEARSFSAQQFQRTSGINDNSLICNPYGCTAGQQTQWFPPSFVPATTQDTAQSLGQRFENIDLRYSQPYEPIPNSRQVFDQQQQALQLMATTIGSTISKGFVMPRKEYMTFHGNVPIRLPEFHNNL